MDAEQLEGIILTVRILSFVLAPVTVLVSVIAYFYREDRERIKNLENRKATNGYVRDVEYRSTQAISQFRTEVNEKLNLIIKIVESQR
jgi:heme/copper-type cytochrome/quinol oxidase subunit 2